MIRVDIDIDKADNWSAKTRAGIVEYLKTGADRGHAVASDRVPVDRGAGGGLLSGIFEPTVEEGKVVWGVRDMPHARPIEEGTEPFWAPIQPLKEWAQRVTGDAGFGYYVQWKIAQEGIDAQPYIAPGRGAQLRWYRSHDASAWIDREFQQ